MKYSNGILTLIAICLVILTIDRIGLIRNATADSGPMKVAIVSVDLPAQGGAPYRNIPVWIMNSKDSMNGAGTIPVSIVSPGAIAVYAPNPLPVFAPNRLPVNDFH